MKLLKIFQLPTYLAVVLIMIHVHVMGQSSFVNLDFESSLVEQTQAPGSVDVTDALPSWSVYYGPIQPATVLYSMLGIGGTHVDLIGTNFAFGSGFRSIEGEFSVLLQGGTIAGPGGILVDAPASIRQTGQVPVSARSIFFKAQKFSSPGIMSLSLGGVALPYYQVGTGPNYELFGADVTPFSGQVAALEFTVSRLPGDVYGEWNIDSIEFSASTIPEPNGIVLGVVGALICGVRRLKIEARRERGSGERGASSRERGA